MEVTSYLKGRRWIFPPHSMHKKTAAVVVVFLCTDSYIYLLRVLMLVHFIIKNVASSFIPMQKEEKQVHDQTRDRGSVIVFSTRQGVRHCQTFRLDSIEWNKTLGFQISSRF